jgi:Tfp pilus assembly protein PilN
MPSRRQLFLLAFCALLAGVCAPVVGVRAQAAATSPVELSGPALLAALSEDGWKVLAAR